MLLMGRPAKGIAPDKAEPQLSLQGLGERLLHREAMADRGREPQQACVQGDDGGCALPHHDKARPHRGPAAAALPGGVAARGRPRDPAGM